MKYLYLFLVLLFTACYSFKTTTIPLEINTFSVQTFEVQALNAPTDIDQTFTEELRNKIRNESRLDYNTANGDVEFSGKVTEYSINPVAAREGEIAELTRLVITVSVDYVSLVNEKDKWTQRFSRFAEFDSSTDFNSVQNTLTEQIYDELVEDIFNKAFNNW